MPPWDNYRDRFNQRPETLDAYVDVWKRVPEAQQSFGGWVGFMQAANAEPSWVANRPERVRIAEEIMRSAGYEVGSTTPRGAGGGSRPNDRSGSGRCGCSDSRSRCDASSRGDVVGEDRGDLAQGRGMPSSMPIDTSCCIASTDGNRDSMVMAVPPPARSVSVMTMAVIGSHRSARRCRRRSRPAAPAGAADRRRAPPTSRGDLSPSGPVMK